MINSRPCMCTYKLFFSPKTNQFWALSEQQHWAAHASNASATWDATLRREYTQRRAYAVHPTAAKCPQAFCTCCPNGDQSASSQRRTPASPSFPPVCCVCEPSSRATTAIQPGVLLCGRASFAVARADAIVQRGRLRDSAPALNALHRVPFATT